MTDQTPDAQPKIRLVRPSTLPSIYVEGITQMMVGFPNSRIMFNSMAQQKGEGETAEEVHSLACELVVPTTALIEIIQALTEHLAGNKQQLQQAGAEWLEKSLGIVDTLPSKASQD